jgi:LCP family protein required for cell wall assembly
MVLPEGVKLRRTWPQRLALGFLCCSVLVSFGTAGALAYFNDKVSQLQQVELGHVLALPAERAEGGEPLNILLVGVDNEEGLDPDDPRMQDRDGGLRSDTVMLLRADPNERTAVLLSFPRDLWLPLGGDGSYDKLNAALGVGGQDLLIETIAENFDVEIHHYVEVNFAQFQDLVDVIGGVPIPFDTPVRDVMTGLDVPERGCVILDGPRALDYVRSRQLEYFVDDYWETDPYADLSRIRRQQDFIRRAVERGVSRGLSNPITLDRLIDTGLESITVDENFSPAEIASLARRFRSFDPADLVTYPLPVEVDETYGGASIVRMIDGEARPILDLFRGDRTSTAALARVRLDVLEGSGRDSGARQAAGALGGAGFTVLSRGGTGTVYEWTTIRHRPQDRYEAEMLAQWLVGPVEFEENEWLDSEGIVLVTGEDWAGVRSSPLITTPTTTPPAPGDPADPADTTTTTALGVVPSEGQKVDLCD